MRDLEGQLGELTGYLRSLVPTLEKVEQRQTDAGQKYAGMEARHEALRNEYNEFRLKVSNRIGEHYKKIEEIKGDIKDQKAQLDTVKSEMAYIKEKSSGTKQKIWDVFKVLITVGVTLLASKFVGK